MNCSSCKFWFVFARLGGKRKDVLLARGTCDRFPPVLDQKEPGDASDEPTLWLHPVTEEDDGCGEYQPRVPA